jgi:broad specificity phosphatase PhoE
LTLVRHGQASLFADDYDRLSAVGEQQGRLLGQYWARQGVAIDEVYIGPRVRQRMSAELAGYAYEQAGGCWPKPVGLEELDEFDLDGLMKRFAPRLASRNSGFARLTEAYLQSDGEQNRLRNFHRTFAMLVHHWQTAEPPDADVESWPEFRQRVVRVIRRIQETTGRSKRVVLFTSGGFIGCVLQHVLGVSDRITLEMNWRIRNGSLTEFVFTPDRLTLDAFNMIPHLPDQALWTYR